MKKTIFTITILIIIAAMLFTGCDVLVRVDGNDITGSGDLETRQFDFIDFTRVDIGSAFEYEIVQADTFSVSVTADDNLFDDIEVTKEGQTLKINLSPFWNFGAITLEAAITMPRLTGLESSGATRGMVSGFSSGDNLDLNVSGASRVDLVEMTTGDVKGNISGASELEGELTTGDIDLQVSGASDIKGSLTARNVEYEVSGASKIQLDGSADDIVIDASGMSRIRLGDFTVSNADITLSGASSCDINVTGRIDIDLSGLSELEYTGQPVLGSIEMSGGSSIDNKSGD